MSRRHLDRRIVQRFEDHWITICCDDYRLDNSCTRGTADQYTSDCILSTSVELFEERTNLVESRPSSHLVVVPVELDEALVLQFGEDYVMEFVTEGNVLLTTERLVSPKDWFRLPRRLG